MSEQMAASRRGRALQARPTLLVDGARACLSDMGKVKWVGYRASWVWGPLKSGAQFGKIAPIAQASPVGTSTESFLKRTLTTHCNVAIFFSKTKQELMLDSLVQVSLWLSPACPHNVLHNFRLLSAGKARPNCSTVFA